MPNEISALNRVALRIPQVAAGIDQPEPQGLPPGTGKPCCAFLMRGVKEKPDITMPELAAEFEARHAIKAGPPSLARFLCNPGFSYKTLLASEHTLSDVAKVRDVWIAKRLPIMRTMRLPPVSAALFGSRISSILMRS